MSKKVERIINVKIDSGKVGFKWNHPFKLNSIPATRNEDGTVYGISEIKKGVHIFESDSYDDLQNVQILEDGIYQGRSFDAKTTRDYVNILPTKDIEDSNTYSLLRANPKLTGNIKLVVDSDSNLYIDTFRANTTLSKNKYHKIPVSYKSYYGRDIMSVFRDVVSDELYGTPKEYNYIFSTTNSTSGQYGDMYRCGATTNADNLYRESFSILSPLHIGTSVPDFFVVFKVEDTVPQTVANEDVMPYLIEHGSQVKAYDMREGTKLGTYLREIQHHATSFISEAYMTRKANTSNSFYGISVDSGVYTSAFEASDRNTPVSIIDVDYILSTAYERHRLVSPNTVNMEFMFDDDTAEQFSTNTYFGVYINANEQYSNIYGMLDKNGNVVFKYGADDSKVITISDIVSPEKCIVGFTTSFGDGFIRRTPENKATIDRYVSDRLGNNVVFCDATKVEVGQDYKSFITISINGALEAGEHLRIIQKASTGVDNAIYDVILSNSGMYDSEKYGISDESTYCKKHKVISDGIQRTLSYQMHSIAVSTTYGDVTTERLRRAFEKFDDAPFDVTAYNDKSITISSKTGSTHEYFFERISSVTGYDSSKETVLSQAEEDKEKVIYFGSYAANPILINPDDEDDPIYSEDASGIDLTPFYFEVLGKRLVYCVGFINMASSSYTLYEGTTNIQEGILSDELCFRSSGQDKKIVEYVENGAFDIVMKDIDQETNKIIDTTKSVNYIYSFNNPTKYMFKYGNTTEGDNPRRKIALYEHNTVNYVVCGIYPTKDYCTHISNTSYGNTNDKRKDMASYAIVYDEKVRSSSKPLQYVFKNGVTTAKMSILSDYMNMWNVVGSGKSKSSGPSVTYDTDYDIQKGASITSDPINLHVVEYDLAKTSDVLGGLSIRNAYINGSFETNALVQDIIASDTDTSKKTNSRYTKNILNKVSDTELSVIESGYKTVFTLSNDNSGDITTSADGSRLFVITSPYTDGVTTSTELFIDTVEKVSILVMYGAVSPYDKNTIPIKIDVGGVPAQDDDNVYTKLPIPITGNDTQIINDHISVSKSYKYNVEYESGKGKQLVMLSDIMGITGEIDDDGTNEIKTKSSNYDELLCSEKLFDNEAEPKDTFLKEVTKDSRTQTVDSLLSKHKTIYIYISNLASNTTGNVISDTTVFIKNGNTEFTQTDDIVDINVSREDVEITDIWGKEIAYRQGHVEATMSDVFKYTDISSDDSSIISKGSCVQLTGLKWKSSMPYVMVSHVVSTSDPNPPGIELYKDYELSSNIFAKNLYHGVSTTINGYEEPKMFKTFYNSTAIQRKHDGNAVFTIDRWPKTFKQSKKIYFDITNALVSAVLSNGSFNKFWSAMGITNNAYKKKYILNSILPLFNIDSKCEISVYFRHGTTNTYITQAPSKTVFSKMELLQNTTASIVTRNGVYYVELEPSKSKIGNYYIQCKITL